MPEIYFSYPLQQLQIEPDYHCEYSSSGKFLKLSVYELLDVILVYVSVLHKYYQTQSQGKI